MPPPVRTKEIVNADGKMEKLVELRLRRNVTLNKNNSMSSEDPSSASLSEASCGVQLEEELHSDCSHDRMTLSAKYLHENRGKRDLVRRLRRVVQVLHEDESIEPDSPDFPGLPGLCQALVTFLPHRDKEVRLYTISACMELFTVYAPDAPWSTQEVFEIFHQTIRQLANLAHTTNRQSPHFNDYERILDLLAQVKIAVILVEMAKEDDHRDEALPLLSDLFKTLLHSARQEHPPQIPELIQQTLSGCLEEFQDGMMLPVPLLDELLVCVGQGPRILVINPANAHRKNPAMLEQTNPSFLVASSVIQSSVDRLATPIAAIINGLLNNDSRLMEESNISTRPTKELGKPIIQDQDVSSDVFNIIYELHRVAPTILTTVIGTLATFLDSSQQDQRQRVVDLLGQLFGQQPKFAQQFRVCFRQWVGRAKDKAPEIRSMMVRHLLQQGLMYTPGYDSISQETQAALQSMLLEDPDPQIRLACIHGVCDHTFAYPTTVSADLLFSLGHKTGTKQKQERKDAVTGLAQNYFQHYIQQRLGKLLQEGEDASVQDIQKILEDTKPLNTVQQNSLIKFEWIPNKVFEAASFQDDFDLSMRIWQAMDDVMLGSELSAKRKLSSTARAVGLAVILENLEENSLAWLGELLRERSRLQRKLMEYMDARALIRSYQPGSEGHLTANANAMDILEGVAAFVNISASTAGERNPLLLKFHGIRDKHIFRILTGIASCTHSIKSRLRAVEEPAKRLKDHGDVMLKFVRTLVRKCAMGDFINQDIIRRCVSLAKECATHDRWDLCRKFLYCVQFASEHFPEVCADGYCFKHLADLFSMCRSTKQRRLNDVVTSLSVITARAATKSQSQDLDSNFYEELLRLCKDGTPQQASHAVKALSAMIKVSPEDSPPNIDSLLNSLSSPSALSRTASCERVISSLAALAQFAEAAPLAMTSLRGQQAVTFALEHVLLGRGDSISDHELSCSDNEIEVPSKKQRRSFAMAQRARDSKNLSPGGGHDLLDDKGLSSTCRRLCGAIEFLTSYTRATCFAINEALSRAATTVPSHPSDTIEKIFETLVKILRDQGVPPTSRDRHDCNGRQDRAALRQCSAINLLRLCDPRVGLDIKYLATPRWHILAGIFLDDERAVREKVISEFGLMLTGQGKYGKSGGFGMAMPPRPKFFALLVLCVDGENATSNGNAASIGKLATHTKMNALACVNAMRAKFEVEAEQARANGVAAEQLFERGGMKFSLMPEYVVPYALHLLAFRKETPMWPSTAGREGDDAVGDQTYDSGSNEVQHRLLRKRLKWLFDPLIHSLGDNADNISFLISLSTKLARFAPTGLSPTAFHDAVACGRLQVVCDASRSVLMTLYVKKDINLAPFPGQIMIPTMLYTKQLTKAVAPRLFASTLSRHSPGEASREPRKPLVPSRDDKTWTNDVADRSLRSPRKSLETGDISLHINPKRKRHPLSEIQAVGSFGALSPVERRLSTTEISRDLLDSGEKTRGSTPPSAVRDMTFGTSASTPNIPLSASVTQSPSSKTSDGTSNAQTRRSLRLSNSYPKNSKPIETQRVDANSDTEKNEKPTTKVVSRKHLLPEKFKALHLRRIEDVAPVAFQSRKRLSLNAEEDLDFSEPDRSSKRRIQPATNKNNENRPQPRASKRSSKS